MSWRKGKKKLKVQLAYRNIINSGSSYDIIKSQLGVADCDYYITAYGHYNREKGFEYQKYKHAEYYEETTEKLSLHVNKVFETMGKTVPVEIILFAGLKTCQAFYTLGEGGIKVFIDILSMDINGRDLQNAVIHELIHGIRQFFNLVPDDSIFKVSFVEEALATFYAYFITAVDGSFMMNTRDFSFGLLFRQLKKVWDRDTDTVFYNFFCSGKIQNYAIPGLGYVIAKKIMELYINDTKAINILEKNDVLQNEFYKRLDR